MPRVLRFVRPGRLLRGIVAATLLLALAMGGALARAALTAPELPVLWTAGGHDAGNSGAGQAYRMAVAPSGNVAVLSAPFREAGEVEPRRFALTAYTADGTFLWRRSILPTFGTFVGVWVTAASNGDFVAVGRSIDIEGRPVSLTLVRYSSDGTFLWREEVPGARPSVGRLLVDSAGNSYLAYNALGEGQDIRLHKYSPSGALLWAQSINSDFMSNDIATSLAFSPDEREIVLTGDVLGGALWITALYDTANGARKWLASAPEGVAALDVVVNGTTVYVTGQGNVGINAYLTVVAYERATGARLWRTDRKPADASGAAGLRISFAPDGSLAVTGQAHRGFLDWYTVALDANGAVRWEAVRDGGLNTDEIPRAVFALGDGTVVVTGRGGPPLPGGYIQGVTAGYGPDGALLWEAFSRMETVWGAALPTGDVCATGGYDALITCWDVPTGAPWPTPTATLPPPSPTATLPPPSPTATVPPAPMPFRSYLPLLTSGAPGGPRP